MDEKVFAEKYRTLCAKLLRRCALKYKGAMVNARKTRHFFCRRLMVFNLF
jgi:hypothetical protein